MATKCLTFDLQANQAGRLHKFLWHSSKIHEDYYQQAVPALDIPLVAKLLEAIQGVPDAVEPEEETDVEKTDFIDADDTLLLIKEAN